MLNKEQLALTMEIVGETWADAGRQVDGAHRLGESDGTLQSAACRYAERGRLQFLPRFRSNPERHQQGNGRVQRKVLAAIYGG